MPKAATPALVRIGLVSGTHGLRGAIRVRLDNPRSDILDRVDRVMLVQDGEHVQYQIVGARPLNHGLVKLTLDGIGTIERAQALVRAAVMVAAADLPAITAPEFYYFQAIGCEVVTTSGSRIGVIEEVFSNGANDIWVVRDDSAERLVPVIEDIVKETDWAGRRVVIEALPGVLD